MQRGDKEMLESWRLRRAAGVFSINYDAVPWIAALVNRTPCKAKITSTVLLVASRTINSPTLKFFLSASLLGRPYWASLRPSILLMIQAVTAKMKQKSRSGAMILIGVSCAGFGKFQGRKNRRAEDWRPSSLGTTKPGLAVRKFGAAHPLPTTQRDAALLKT